MSAHPDEHVGRRVAVALDKPDRTMHGTLVAIGPSGCHVLSDDGRKTIVAWWRISFEDRAEA